jgi:transcriptional regulator with XRE-family HTH domain
VSEKANFSQRVISYRRREDISQEELAHRLGISRNYVSMIEGGRAPSDQVVRHFSLLEASPLPPGPKQGGSSSESSEADRAKETPPDYDLMKKVIFIEEEGTPEQLALLDAFLDKVCEQLGFDRGQKPDRGSQRKPEQS